MSALLLKLLKVSEDMQAVHVSKETKQEVFNHDA